MNIDWDWVRNISGLIGLAGIITVILNKRVRPVVTMTDLLTEVQEERNSIREQRDEALKTIEAMRAECSRSVAEVQAAADRAIAEVRAEREQAVNDLRTQNRVLLAENNEVRDYAHRLRAYIADGSPPPPPDWPRGVPA